MIADLSVDFDFFARELPLWDFGHSEEGMIHELAPTLWQMRYGSVDLHEEAGIHRADFEPVTILRALSSKGIRFDSRRKGRFAIADSHAHGYSFFRSSPKPDMLISLDAHHDFFGTSARLDCGNWARLLYDEWRDVPFCQVYPGWKEPELDGAPTRPIRLERWPSWKGLAQPVTVRNVFVCRSPSWVPPHLDEHFYTLVGMLTAMRGTPVMMDAMHLRPALSEEQAKDTYRQSQANWKTYLATRMSA
jgi:hypothetical protein